MLARRIITVAGCAGLLVATAIGLHGADEAKKLSGDHAKAAAALRAERDAINIEGLRLQAHVAAFNAELAEATQAFRKDLNPPPCAKDFDLEAETFKPCAPGPPARGRGATP